MMAHQSHLHFSRKGENMNGITSKGEDFNLLKIEKVQIEESLNSRLLPENGTNNKTGTSGDAA